MIINYCNPAALWFVGLTGRPLCEVFSVSGIGLNMNTSVEHLAQHALAVISPPNTKNK